VGVDMDVGVGGEGAGMCRGWGVRGVHVYLRV